MNISDYLTYATSVSTIVLVVVTLYYAQQTERTVAEMKEGRQLTPWPVLDCHLILNNDLARKRNGFYDHALHVTNIGNAPALTITWRVEIENMVHSMLRFQPLTDSYPVLAAGLKISLPLLNEWNAVDHPVEDIATAAEEPRARVAMSYTNVYGRQFMTVAAFYINEMDLDTGAWARSAQHISLDH